jgi:hypothetical protein
MEMSWFALVTRTIADFTISLERLTGAEEDDVRHILRSRVLDRLRPQ